MDTRSEANHLACSLMSNEPSSLRNVARSGCLDQASPLVHAEKVHISAADADIAHFDANMLRRNFAQFAPLHARNYILIALGALLGGCWFRKNPDLVN